jgi:hypothetical protein
MSEEKKSNAGRPLMVKSAEELQERIDAYFKWCEGHPYMNEQGEVVTDKYGMPIMVGVRPLTITGLALACGFNSRQALLNYEAREEFNDTIKKAKAVVERYAEERLFDKDGSNGAKFSLANNFKNWNEKQTIDANVNSEVNITIELSDEE